MPAFTLNRLLLVTATLLSHGICSRHPQYLWDENTVSDCIDWYNDDFTGESCEFVRDFFAISPEQFNEWNPSVGVGCTTWHFTQSYCVLTLDRYNSVSHTSTTPTATSTMTGGTATTSATLRPSPTWWEEKGCFIVDETRPKFWNLSSPAEGDSSLTIPACKDTCYRKSFTLAGVQGGNQCWCGRTNVYDTASNSTDCNTPCTGNQTTLCGGDKRMLVYLGRDDFGVPPIIQSSTMTGTLDSTSAGPQSTGNAPMTSQTQTSGAMRNMAMFV